MPIAPAMRLTIRIQFAKIVIIFIWEEDVAKIIGDRIAWGVEFSTGRRTTVPGSPLGAISSYGVDHPTRVDHPNNLIRIFRDI